MNYYEHIIVHYVSIKDINNILPSYYNTKLTEENYDNLSPKDYEDIKNIFCNWFEDSFDYLSKGLEQIQKFSSSTLGLKNSLLGYTRNFTEMEILETAKTYTLFLISSIDFHKVLYSIIKKGIGKHPIPENITKPHEESMYALKRATQLVYKEEFSQSDLKAIASELNSKFYLMHTMILITKSYNNSFEINYKLTKCLLELLEKSAFQNIFF